MTVKEKSHLIDILTQHRVRNRRKAAEASAAIDSLHRKVKGLSIVGMVRKFRGSL